MKSLQLRLLCCVSAILVIDGCASQRDPINRVQPRYQHKSFFLGEDLTDPADDPVFYARGTLADGLMGPSAIGAEQPITRIKWQLTEYLLQARVIDGSGDLGAIVASYDADQFDIQQDYNDTTGELLNTFDENRTDRPWNERAYVRVSWTLNCNVVQAGQAAVDEDSFDLARVESVSRSGAQLSDTDLGAFVAFAKEKNRSFFAGEGLVNADGAEGIAACTTELNLVNRIQPDYQAKSFYVGEDLTSIADDPEFYARGTLVDVGYGASQDGLFTSTWAQPVTRVKWEITEDYLNARLAYERIEGSDGKGNPHSGLGTKTTNDGEIVASYAIKSHFDIQQGYDPNTGTLLNTIVENTVDRPWYERAYIRVDWSINLATNNYGYDTLAQVGIYGAVDYEPLAFTVLDPNDKDAPYFDPSGDYFDITNKVFATPGEVDLRRFNWGIDSFPACLLPKDFLGGSWPAGKCSPVELTVRNSFRKVVDHDYEPVEVDGYRFQSYGIFYEERFGYDRQYGMIDDQWHRFASRYNIWERSHYYADPVLMTGELACNTEGTTEYGIKYDATGVAGIANDPAADPNRDDNHDGTADECEGVTTATGFGGSQCDIFKNRCTLPYRARRPITIPWFVTDLTDDEEIFETTEWATEEWDLAMKAAIRTARLVECRRTGSPDCDTTYPMWSGQQDTTDDAIRLGRTLDTCRRNSGWSSGDCITELEAGAAAYATERGSSLEMDTVASVMKLEPVFVLCHNPSRADDHSACGPVGNEARLGDLRYHAINIVEAPQTPSPWGIMVNAVDPYWGEHVSTSVNIWDHVTNLAAQGVVDEIRYVNGEIPTSEITNGEYVRKWALAQKSRGSPTMSAAEIDRRLAAATDLDAEAFHQRTMQGMSAQLREMVRPVQEEIRRTRIKAGTPSQAKAIAGARMRSARGTAVESALMNPAMMQLAAVPGNLPTDGPIADRVSAFALNNPQVMADMHRMWQNAIAERGACVLNEAPEPTSLSGLADALLRKFPPAATENASERQDRWEAMLGYLRRRFNYGVIIHEMGHAVGLRHNFVSSSDPLFYRPQYWQLRTKNGTVNTICTDAVTDGSTCVGPRYFDPVTDEEQSQMIWKFQQSSVMDYPGDVSQDMIGLGAYDFAAARMFYGDDVSVYSSFIYDADSPVGRGITDATDTFGGLFGIKFGVGKAGGGIQSIHYSELAKEYRVISACYNVTPTEPPYWNAAVDGIWDPLLDGDIVAIDGQYSKCRQMSVDYVGWNDLHYPAAGANNWGSAPNVDSQNRVRAPYGFATDHWADTGNSSVFRHDNGADAYEIASFLINKQENRLIFDDFRRRRTGFSLRSAASRSFSRYNEKLLGLAGGVGFYANIYKNVATYSGFEYAPGQELPAGSFNTLWPSIVREQIPDNIIAASLAFDHFARELTRPENGGHYRLVSAYNDPTLRSSTDADGYGGTDLVVIPTGATGYLKDVGFGGHPLENAYSNSNGDFDTDYTMNAGSYYSKIYTAILLSESEDRFVSQSRGDFYDARFRATGMADAFPEGWRRLIANSLTGDRWVMAPRVAADGAGDPLLDVTADVSRDPFAQLYPDRPMGWVSWWPNSGPQVCFSAEGRNVCREYEGPGNYGATAPANTAAIDPQIGWEVQKFMIAWTLAYIPDNQHSQWIDMMRVYRQGLDSSPAFENRIEWQDPTSGQIYYARTYGRECLFGSGASCAGGRMVEKGIAARVLEYANFLTGNGYELDTAGNPPTANYPAGYNAYGRPMVVAQLDGAPVVKSDPAVYDVSPDGQYLLPTTTCINIPLGTCTPLEIWANHYAVDLENYKSVPDYLWEVMKAYSIATPAQLGVY